jgi:LCP family protein required for cell wall assembly
MPGRIPRCLLVVTLVLCLALAGCSYGGTVPGAVAATTSTAEATSTTAAPVTTTTTTLAGHTITLSLEGSGELEATLQGFYAWLGDPAGGAPPPMADGLREYLADVVVDGNLEVSGQVATADLGGAQVAVATVDDDVVLASDEGSGWQIVGAKLPRFGKPAWYGEPVRTLMVIGTDARPGQDQTAYRADSLHLVTTAVALSGGAVVGIPRDAYVDTPYGFKDKLSSVNARANSEAMVKVVRDVTGLPIEGYVITGFVGFEALIDEFGGVSVEVPFAMADRASKAYLSAGLQLLLGADALAFSRNRHISGGDFTRSFDQGLVILAGLAAVQGKGITALPALLRLLMDHTWTDLPAGDLLTLTAGVFELDPTAVANLVLPGTVGTATGGMSVVFLDPEAEGIYRDLDNGVIDNR